MDLKRLSLLTALALAVVAYAAAPASADILSPGQFGSVYQGAVKGGNTGDVTFTAGSIVITCQTSNMDGVMDGNAPASAELNLSFDGCTTQTSMDCTVNDITGVDVDITEANAPSPTIVNTETFGTMITCDGFPGSCAWSSNPASTPVTIEVDQATQVATIDDTMAVSGLVGCSPSGTGTWSAQYVITDDQDQDLDLWASGTL